MWIPNDVKGGIFEALNGHIYGNQSNPATIVLSHGFGSDQTFWNYLIPSLACFFKVVVFDLAFSPNVLSGFYHPNRYSNYTGYANDLLSVLDELNVERAIFMGHSMSAMIGCLAAAQKPHLFHHLILLAASPRYLNDEGYEGGFNKTDIDTIFDEIKHNYSAWATRFANEVVFVNDTLAVTKFDRSLLRMDPEITLSVADAVFLSDLRKVLSIVPVPSTVIESQVDIIVPKSVGHYIEKNLGGNSSLKILPIEGHFPQLTNPRLLLSVLKNTLGLDADLGSC